MSRHSHKEIERCKRIASKMTVENPAEGSFAAPAGSALAWQCNLGNGQWDHDWQEKHDDAGEVDGIQGDHWSWRECRVCGAIEGEAPNMQNTKIQWADHTWSPWRGCTKVSPGCANCYAESLAKRFGDEWGGWGKGKPRVESKSWGDPMRWNDAARRQGTKRGTLGLEPQSRPRVFPSLCDWLDEEVPALSLGTFLALIELTPHLDWLLLTKRPELFVRRLSDVGEDGADGARIARKWLAGNAPSNVWFGVSVEDQIRAEERVKLLQQIPARVRWLSCEPLLEPIDLQYAAFNGADSIHRIPDVDWVVVGGESGPGARPCNVYWVRDIIRQCRQANVAVFVKQLGARPVTTNFGQPLPEDFRSFSDPKCGDPQEWPEDLRVRQFPVVPVNSLERAIV